MDNNNYLNYQKERFAEYEKVCKRCGQCCGAYDGDPCANLSKNADGTYFCKSYEDRLKQQTTVSGKKFFCIPIREIVIHSGARPGCAYNTNYSDK